MTIAIDSLNNAVKAQNNLSGITWHYTTWLACALDFNVMHEGLRAILYEAHESRDAGFIDATIRQLLLESADVPELQFNLEKAEKLGWITKARLPNCVFLENGDRQCGRTSFEYWFYAESCEALAHKVNAWAHQQIQTMKKNNPLSIAQAVVNDVAGLNA